MSAAKIVVHHLTTLVQGARIRTVASVLVAGTRIHSGLGTGRGRIPTAPVSDMRCRIIGFDLYRVVRLSLDRLGT